MSIKLPSQKFLFVIVLAFCIAILANLYVIIGFAKTPPQQTYLWTGHYYLDYFYYLQPISQGLRGGLVATQLSATDDPSLYPHFEPYILIGQFGRLFHLSPISAYWVSVFLFTTIMIVLEYFVVSKLLSKYSFSEKLVAFLLTIFATPFYILHSVIPLQIIIYEFWYSPSNFFNRLGPVPHHLLASVVILVAMILSASTIDNIKQLRIKALTFRAIIIAFLIVFGLTFLPFPVAVFFAAFVCSVLFYLIISIKKSDKKKSLKLLLLSFIVCIIVIPLAFIIKYYYNTITFFASTKGVEVAYHQYLPLSTLLLSIGPLLLFVPFGIRSYLAHFKAIKLILLSFVLISFGLFFTNIDRLFNTHNARFLSPLSYILFGSVAVMGMKTISKIFKSYHKIAFLLMFFLMFILSMPVNIYEFERRINDKNIFSSISSLPSKIIDGFVFLDQKHDEKTVLTTPIQFLGIILPIYVNKHVYIARDSATPHYLEKTALADQFYRGAMPLHEAYAFLKKNNIGYIVLTSIEGYVPSGDFRTYDFTGKIYAMYPFLKEIYKNKDIVIFKVR